MRKLLLPFLSLALVACQSDEQYERSFEPATSDRSAPLRLLRVDWYGHECFQFTSALGLKILVNPYRDSAFSGHLPGDLKPDVVLITSDEPGFNNDEAYSNTPVTYRGPIAAGLNNAGGIRIRGIPTVKDESSAEKVNLVFSWTMDGLRICFAGNLQRPLTSYELTQLGPVDVLFLPVGLPANLSSGDREEIIRQLHPRIIVPMGPAGSVSSANFGGYNSYRLIGSSVFLSRENLTMEPTTLILSAP